MSLITSSNKHAFKEWLREYRKMFGSDPIIRDYMGLVSKFLTSSQTGVTSDPSKPVNIVAWETFDETVDLTGNLIIGEYYYFPALMNDQVKIKNGSTTVTLDFDDDGKIRNKNLGDYVDIGDVRLTLRGIGGTLGQAGQGVSYAIAPNVTTVNEGVTITFTITTTNIANGTTVYWDTTGGVNAADFSDNAISGNVNVNNNTATFTRTLANDLSLNQTEGTETFQIRVSDGTSIVATSPTITVNDTSYAGYTCTVSSTTPSEGSTLTATCATVGVPNGTDLYFKAVKADGSGNVSSGNSGDIQDITRKDDIQNNTTDVVFTINQDFVVDTGEQFKIEVRTGSYSGTLVATSPVCTIQDVPFSVSITPSTTSPTEGDTVTFTVNTTGVADGSSLWWQIYGLDTYDVNDRKHSFSINNNTGSFSVIIKQDLVVENAEPFTVQIRPRQSSNTVLVTSSTITIADASFTINITPDKTTVVESVAGRSNTKTTETVTFNFATVGIPNGTQLRLYPNYVTGEANVQHSLTDDISDSSSSTQQSSYYTITVNNNVATKTFYIIADAETEGTEVFNLLVKNSTGNYTVATSPNITITDKSWIGSRKTDKTFGPIRVERDNGNASNVSDWYTICGLDKLPNNSKVAIFIDKSGSMTQSTISASYDLLMSKLQARNMDVITKTDMNEDWISPFTGIIDDP